MIQRLLLLSLCASLANCGDTSSRLSSDSTNLKYGLSKNDRISISLTLDGCPKKVWPYMIAKADYRVDSKETLDMVALDLFTTKHATPVWSSSKKSYSSTLTKKISGADLAALIENTGKQEFGNSINDTNDGVESIYIYLVNNSSTYGDDAKIYDGIRVRLPIKSEGKYLYNALDPKSHKEIDVEISRVTGCKTSGFLFEVRKP